jgi:hypothetical protein
LLQGHREVWACAIVHAIGKVNFLFDPSQTPHLAAMEICSLMGVGSSTASAKGKEVLKHLKAGQMDPLWCTPANLENNPLAWSVMINGIIVDARELPVAFQRHLVSRGLIPFVPSDRDEADRGEGS